MRDVVRPSDSMPREFTDAFEAIGPRLRHLGHRVLFYDRIGSTNDVAAALAGEAGAEGTVVMADAQTSGRGRRGRSWFSPPGAGLYVSVVLTPGRAAVDAARATTLVTLAAGVALAEGVQAATGLAADIKWPNDLLVGRRKLAGILAEGVAPGGIDTAASSLHVVLGFGINISPAAYPPDVSVRATSLEGELGRAVDRGVVCAHVLAALAARDEDLRAGRFAAILDDWRRRAPGCRGARVRWQHSAGPRTGITAGIDETGALLVQVDDTIEQIVAGEVLWE